jgi:hypothetical protein
MAIEKNQRSDILKDVIDLEDTNSGVIVTLAIPLYNKMSSIDGKNDETIFHEISLFQDRIQQVFGDER